MSDHETFNGRTHGCLVIVLVHKISVSVPGLAAIPKMEWNHRAVRGSFSKEVSV